MPSSASLWASISSNHIAWSTQIPLLLANLCLRYALLYCNLMFIPRAVLLYLNRLQQLRSASWVSEMMEIWNSNWCADLESAKPMSWVCPSLVLCCVLTLRHRSQQSAAGRLLEGRLSESHEGLRTHAEHRTVQLPCQFGGNHACAGTIDGLCTRYFGVDFSCARGRNI